jgi:inorganic pyrophosphatase
MTPRILKSTIAASLAVLLALLLTCNGTIEAGEGHGPIGIGCRWIDAYTIEGPRDFESGYSPRNKDGTINVVVEIPAGSTAKWEVNGKIADGTKPTDGRLRWEFKKGRPRVVRYLGYPGNYGFVPRTLGGDNDPLDVLVLGPTVARGSVIRARVVAVLKIIDGDEVDDKLIAVMNDTPLAEARSLEKLKELFPGVTTIVKTWFTSYKGSGVIVSKGWGDTAIATSILETAIAAHEK